MKKTSKKPIETRWSKVSYDTATYKYYMDDKDVAAIFPKETKEGRIAWGYFVKRIENSKEINSSNYVSAPIKMEPYYMKKKDAKLAVETLIKELICQSPLGTSLQIV